MSWRAFYIIIGVCVAILVTLAVINFIQTGSIVR